MGDGTFRGNVNESDASVTKSLELMFTQTYLILFVTKIT